MEIVEFDEEHTRSIGQLRLEKRIERELEILSRLDPLDDMEQFKIFQKLFIENSTKYIKRYENYKSPYKNPSRFSSRGY